MAFAERRHCRVNGFLRFGRNDRLGNGMTGGTEGWVQDEGC